jgi:hypothetical protein
MPLLRAKIKKKFNLEEDMTKLSIDGRVTCSRYWLPTIEESEWLNDHFR